MPEIVQPLVQLSNNFLSLLPTLKLPLGPTLACPYSYKYPPSDYTLLGRGNILILWVGRSLAT